MRPNRIEELQACLLNALRKRTEETSLQVRDATCVSEGIPGHCHTFYWNRRALRAAALTLAVLTLAALPVVTAESATARVLGLGWLALLLNLAHVVGGRARSRNPVLTIDALGITDRRLMSGRMYWQDIAAVDHANLERAQTIELFLKQPKQLIPGAHRVFRFGVWCQRRLSLPGVTINLLMVDARAIDVARAVAEFRPGLLPLGMLKSARPGAH